MVRRKAGPRVYYEVVLAEDCSSAKMSEGYLLAGSVEGFRRIRGESADIYWQSVVIIIEGVVFIYYYY